MMRERDIEKILVGEVKRMGGRAYKWVSPGNDGVPDRIVIFPGRRPVFVELKTETGKLCPLQAAQVAKLKGSVWPCRRKGIPGGARREDTWNLSRTHTSSTALTGLSK